MTTRQQSILAPELADRFAAIDVGTNSIRMIVAEAQRDGKYRILDDEKDSTRLGKNLDEQGRLDPAAADASIAALRRMYEIVRGHQVRKLRAIATCAVREAADGEEFCQRVKKEVGLNIEVISANREAELAYYSVARNIDLEGQHVAVADMGGGSTEIILGSGSVIEAIYNTKLGAVRLSERHQLTEATGKRYNRLIRDVDRTLRKQTKSRPFAPHRLIGTGGTFTSLGAIILAQQDKADLPIRGMQITRAELRQVLERLRKLSPKALRNVAGLNPERADIIVAGLAAIDRIMHNFEVNQLQIHDGGVRDGLMLTMVDKALGPRRKNGVDRQAAVQRFADRCGTDRAHGRHVAFLAGEIYAQVADLFDLDPADRDILEAAAHLQDVGYLINYKKHHLHSYHLILNSHLDGWKPEELEIIANVARYHRGARPKPKHDHFKSLSRENRRRVTRLAAVLRLAGGLDRSHSQSIKNVDLQRKGDLILLRVVADRVPEVDIWGARRRLRLFEKTFRTSIAIAWKPPNASNDVTADPAAEVIVG